MGERRGKQGGGFGGGVVETDGVDEDADKRAVHHRAPHPLHLLHSRPARKQPSARRPRRLLLPLRQPAGDGRVQSPDPHPSPSHPRPCPDSSPAQAPAASSLSPLALHPSRPPTLQTPPDSALTPHAPHSSPSALKPARVGLNALVVVVRGAARWRELTQYCTSMRAPEPGTPGTTASPRTSGSPPLPATTARGGRKRETNTGGRQRRRAGGDARTAANRREHQRQPLHSPWLLPTPSPLHPSSLPRARDTSSCPPKNPKPETRNSEP